MRAHAGRLSRRATLALIGMVRASGSCRRCGGPGIAQTVTVFGPMLLAAGVSEATLRRVPVDNPRRFLAFVPKNG